MKWIGQHIFDLISRLRNDVYLESLSNAGADTDKFLVIDANDKVAFRTGAEVLSDSGGVNGSTLSNIGNVTIGTKINGDLLKWNGSAWINSRTLSSIQSVSFVNNAAGIQTLANDVLSIGSSGSIKLSLDTDQAQSASDGTFSIINGSGTTIYSLDEGGNIRTKLKLQDSSGTDKIDLNVSDKVVLIKDTKFTTGKLQDNAGTNRIDLSDTSKTKINKNLQLLGSSPATLSGPSSDILKVESASDLEFKTASGGASSKSFKFYNNTTQIASINQDGDMSVSGDFTVTGDLLVSGNNVTVNTANMLVEDPLIGLASGNGANSVDIGIWGKYTNSGAKYSGLFRDASDGDTWKLFATTGNNHESPGTGTTINTTSGFTLANLDVNVIDAASALVSGTINSGAITSTGNSTFAGKVGINTALTAAILTVTGTVAHSWAGRFENTSTDGFGVLAKINSTSSGDIILEARTGSTSVFKVTGDSNSTFAGKVGINETSPDAKLHISDSATPNIKFERPGAKKWAIGISGTDFIIDDVNDDLSTHVLKLAADNNATFAGNIEFGDSHVIGDDGDDNLLIQSSANENIVIDSADDIILDADGGDVIFRDGGTEFGRITNSSGNLVIKNNLDDGDIIFQSDDGSGGVATYLYLDGGGGLTRLSKKLRANDNTNIEVGSAGDLKITHDGTNSLITNETGSLVIRNNADDSDIIFQSDNGSGGVSTYLTLDGSSGGNVGIGTSSPSTLLHVSKASSNSQLTLERTGSATGKYLIYTNTNNLYINNVASSTLPLAILNNGNIGIGTISPDTKLHVDGGNSNNVATFESTDDTARIILKDNDTEGYFIAKDSVMSVGGSTTIANNLNVHVTSGNIGVGTASPAVKLDFGSALGKAFHLRTNGADYYGFNMLQYDSGPYSTNIFSGNGGEIKLRTVSGSSTQVTRLTVKADGKVGIGTISPGTINGVAFSSVGLHVKAGTLGRTITEGSNWAEYILNDSGASANQRAKFIEANNGTLSLGSYDDNGTQRTQISILNDGNVGIGTTGPQSKLHIETGSGGTYSPNVNHDDVTIEGSGNIGLQFFSPATSYQYIAFGDPGSVNAGYIRYHHGTNQMVFRTSGSDNMVINSNGNVGVGTTSPLTKLHIAGTTNANIIRIENTATALSVGDTIGAIQFFNNDTTDDSPNVAASIYATAGASGGSGSLRFKTTEPGTEGGPATDSMIITNGGNVGIGTTAPAGKLHVKNVADFYTSLAGSDSAIVFLEEGDNPWRMGNKASDDSFRITQSATSLNVNTRLTIANGGNVGIGTTSPVTKLHLYDAAATVGLSIQADNAGSSDINLGDEDDINIGRIKYDHGTDSMHFQTNNAERMRILSGGNVGIGTTGPSNPLHVFKNASLGSPASPNVSNAGLRIQDSHNSMYFDGNAIVSVGAGNLEIGAATTSMLLITNGAERMRITSAGNVGIGTTSPAFALDVNGDIRIEDNHFLRFGDDDSASQWAIQHTGANLNFAEVGSADNRLYLKAGGNIGIGTASPASKLHVAGTITGTSLDINGEANISDHLVVKGTTARPLSSLFAGSLVVQGGNDEDPLIAVTDVNEANAAAGVFHQSSASPGFPALVINAHSNGNEQPLISARTNVNNSTGLGGTEVFAVDGDGDATFAGNISLTGGGTIEAPSSNGGEDLILKAAGGIDVLIDSNSNGGDNEAFRVLKHSSSLLFTVSETGQTTVSGELEAASLDINGISNISGASTFGNEVYVSGKLGINTTDPDTQGYSYAEDLVVLGGNSSSDGVGITLRGNGKRYGVIAFGDDADHNAGEIYYDHTSNSMNFRVNATVRWVVNDSEATLSHGQLILGGTGRIQGIDTVSAGTDAANKTYVDAHLPLAGGTMTGTTRHGDDVYSYWGTGSDLRIYHNSSNGSNIWNTVGHLTIQNTADDQDIRFYCDDGAGGNAEYFTLDGGSTHAYFSNPGNVGIGTSSPSANLHVTKANATAVLEIQGGLNTITAVDQEHGRLDFGANDGSVIGGIASSIRCVSEFSNGAHAGITFWTGQQNRSGGYLAKAMHIRNNLNVDISGALNVSGGGVSLGGTGRIQGIDTVSDGTDAANKTYVDTAVANLVDSAPGALNTLNELAAALGDDASFSTTITNSIATKLPLTGGTISGNLSVLTGAGTGSLTVGRNSNENTVIHVGDNHHTITATNDADGNSTHNFVLDRVFGGSGANNFVVSKGGTAQLTIDTSGNASFAGDVTVDKIKGSTYSSNSFLDFDYDETAASNTTTLASIARINYIADTNGNDGATSAGHVFYTGTTDIDTATELLSIKNNGNATFAGTLTVSGAAKIEETLFYDKSASSLNTTGYACAGLSSGSNGESATFVFECGGGSGNTYQRIVYNCWNVSGTWNTSKSIDEGGNVFDVSTSPNGSTITFKFKTRSVTMNYTPRVHVQASGTSIVNTY